MDASQDIGTPAYLISSKWLKKYKRYILYDQFSYGYSEEKINIPDNHWDKAHPGPIKNTEFLEEDREKQNLYGTGTQ